MLVSPVAALARVYLFSLQELQHLMIILVAAPLLAFGLPAETWQRLAVKYPGIATVLFRKAPVSLALYALVLYAWHIPFLYNLAARSLAVGFIEHMDLLAIGLLIWLRVTVSIFPKGQYWALYDVAYMFTLYVINSALSIILGSVPFRLYTVFDEPVDSYGLLHLIRSTWGITRQADQAAGSTLVEAFWVGAFLITMALLFARWYRRSDAEPAERLQT